MHALPYWRLSGYYFFYFAFIGAFSPYFGLYLQSLGFSAWDIGLLMSQMQLMRLFGPNLWGWLADRCRRRVPIVRLAGVLSLGGFTAFFWLERLPGLLVAMAILAFFWSAALPLVETLTFDHLREQPASYSRIRVWGSIGFIVAVLAAGAYLDLLAVEPQIVPGQTDLSVPVRGEVELRDVTFAYREGETVLNRMSFVAEPGKVTALVGPSGGGKSTVLALLLRFYETTSGAILIDGQSISSVSRKSLRQQTAYVGQDVYLFRDSIRANIAFGKIGATEEEIVAAAKAACAHDFIMGFPLGYDTPVGEHGAQLSGGQRQRIAVARALIRNAPIILLDEATAALDSESEKQVQEAIEHLCQDRTTIVIAHRLHTITHADAILVVEGGEIVERGQHDELLRRNGRYASFFRLQYRDPGELRLAPVSATA